MQVVIAHIAGLPVEEMLPLAYGGGAAWLAARVLNSSRTGRAKRTSRRASKRLPSAASPSLPADNSTEIPRSK